MMTGNTAIHIASQLQSGAPRKAAFLVAVLFVRQRDKLIDERICCRVISALKCVNDAYASACINVAA